MKMILLTTQRIFSHHFASFSNHQKKDDRKIINYQHTWEHTHAQPENSAHVRSKNNTSHGLSEYNTHHICVALSTPVDEANLSLFQRTITVASVTNLVETVKKDIDKYTFN